ncbi:ATP-binding protein [Sphingomonas oryzagri]|uniref:ATP-binding protein n=1 Tax=Sphingomonas oryzagri TaxID=3042314 RepID=A0ABT6N1M4_9SPHN|nr:ATP-binding protein [Sphingomonas oryzagri]MDH7639188.1 ATP-binding protein [Sphingomonas oryzagri]
MAEQARLALQRPRSAGSVSLGTLLGTWWNWLLGTPRLPAIEHDYGRQNHAAEAPEALEAANVARARAAPDKGTRAITSRIVEAFDSAHPVRHRENLHGRDDKLESLCDAVLFGRQHAIIHGARGSGKTSLSQVFGDCADQQGAIVLYTACEAQASFADLIGAYIPFLPDSCVPLQDKATFRTERDNLPKDIGPRAIVDFLSCLAPDCQIILILDEFDRVTDPEVNDQVATLMKLLSDARSPVQFLLVGIARTVDEIIVAHPSLRRHLVPIPIGRISSQDTFALIEKGAARAGVQFSEDSRAEITAISCGSPYHAQLFCYVAALEAVRRKCDTIDLELTRIGMRRAFDTWSKLNPDDAALFGTLASGSDEQVEAVRAAALEAATHDCLAEDGPGVRLLGPALLQDHEAGRFYFRDSAAPQLLLAMLASGAGRADDGR